MQIFNRNTIMLSATMFALFTIPTLSIAATVFTSSVDFITATDEDEFTYTFSKTTGTGFLFFDYGEFEVSQGFNVLKMRNTEPELRNSEVLEYGFTDNLEGGNVSHISSFSIPVTVWFMGSGLLAFLGFSIKNQDPSVTVTNVDEFNYTKLAESQLLKSEDSH